MRVLQARLLNKVEFAPFGDVIETEGAEHFSINNGTVERFHDLARIELDEAGRPLISIVESRVSSALSVAVSAVERHPLGSQAFIPLDDTPMCVVVAEPGPEPGELLAFVTNGRQGVNYHRGTWHMPLTALEEGQRFLVVDRGGAGHNCEVRNLEEPVQVSADSIRANLLVNR